MKLNWGSGIAIFYTCFVIAMITMVVKSSQNKVHMVQENYYEKDLNYEAFRQKRQNGMTKEGSIDIKYSSANNEIFIAFPQRMSEASGDITLFRPSNHFLDQKIKLNLDQKGQMKIPIEKNMVSGLWKVQVDWDHEGKKFYKEESIVIS
jgi:nitrogen fixation protein FixH